MIVLLRTFVTIKAGLPHSTIWNLEPIMNALEEGEDKGTFRVGDIPMCQFPEIPHKSHNNRASASNNLVSIGEAIRCSDGVSVQLLIDKVWKERIYQHISKIDRRPIVHGKPLKIDCNLWKMVHLIHLETSQGLSAAHFVESIKCI
jgi:hypothetical protein